MATRGFLGRRRDEGARALPPGQYVEQGFPVLSYEPTPTIDTADWRFTVGADAGTAEWGWDEMLALPQTEVTVDIHCVTSWSKFATTWVGVTIDDFLDAAGIEVTQPHAWVTTYTDYTTNLPVEDVLYERAMVAHTFDGGPLDAEHGGPARLFVPHLYFWKSAKWVNRIEFRDEDEPGFWEAYGYHMRGDPWLEQRYAGD